MTTRHEVKCITKSNRFDPHERILSIGGKNHDGSNWKLPQKAAIEGIESGKWSFYVAAQGKVVNVVVAISRFGHKYLKTEADGEQPNNLLSLYECIN